MYQSIHFQLLFETSIPFNQFDRSNAIPIAIRSFSDSFYYSDFTATIIPNPNSPIHGPILSWESLILKQPSWIQDLLEQIHFPSGFPNPYEIIEIFDKEGKLVTVSDGFVKFHDMSFGWVFATRSGNVLAQGAGPCNGRGNSLRSEGAGMLAVTVLISLILTYTNRSKICLVCVSDNLELINRMNEHNEYDHPFPNETTKSEYDITEPIFRTTKAYNITAEYVWVRGH